LTKEFYLKTKIIFFGILYILNFFLQIFSFLPN